jgi:hypothetical protein
MTKAASFAHCQNFSAVGLSHPLRAAIPITIGFGSGARRISFIRCSKVQAKERNL